LGGRVDSEQGGQRHGEIDGFGVGAVGSGLEGEAVEG